MPFIFKRDMKYGIVYKNGRHNFEQVPEQIKILVNGQRIWAFETPKIVTSSQKYGLDPDLGSILSKSVGSRIRIRNSAAP